MKAEDILKDYIANDECPVLPEDSHLQYEGRIDFGKEEGPLWTYPATSVRLRFRGSSLKVVLSNYRAYWDNFLGYVLDGVEHCVKLNESGITVIRLFEGESEEEAEEETEQGGAFTCREGEAGRIHDLLLFKRQDSCHMVQIHGFIGSGDFELHSCPPLSSRRIEVYGDSVSAGEVSEAVEYCGEPDPPHNGEYSNSYYSYAWLTARKLGARIHDIAQGGIALMDGTGYFMEPEQQGIERIYDKVQYQPQILNQSACPLGADGGRDPLKWDFSRYEPQVVIVAVGQNDAHPVDFAGEDYEGERMRQWKKQYMVFLDRLRRVHPCAHIICMTTILGHHENWDRAIEEVCRSTGDSRVYHFLFSNNGRGTRGHIRRPEAERMAEELSAYIEGLGEQIWRDTYRMEAAFTKASAGESLTVGFLGGSITQGSLASVPENCYASRVCRWWQEKFPGTKIRYVNAGIGGTTSHFGVARAWEDLLFTRPDVVFVEFSVNDEDTEHFRECYEGLLRRILKCDWNPAVVLLHNRFYSDGRSAQRIHDELGRYYCLPRVCMGDAIYPGIVSGELAMEEITPDGLHPNDRGHAMLADCIDAMLERVYHGFCERKDFWKAGDRIAGKVPAGFNEEDVSGCAFPSPMTRNRYENARRLRNETVTVYCRGFEADYEEQGGIKDVFKKGWQAGHVGAEICFEVEAACIGIQYRRTVRKPAPKAVAVVDGNEEGAVVLDGNFDEDWGDCLALQLLLEDAEAGRHTVTVRIVEAEEVVTPFYLVSLIVA